MVRGRFIVFEGIDGSGKSTAIRSVAAALQEAGHPVHLTREETDSWRGDAVRRNIAEKGNPWTTLHLFLADRASHVAEIEQELAAGRHVLCDRFMHSTLAYQSVALAEELDDAVERLRALHAPWCPKPDQVVLFDLPAEVAVGRAEGRGATTPYEKVDFLTRVHEAYRSMVESDGFDVVDATQSPDHVAAAALDAVQAAL